MIYRLYVEKKEGFDHEAKALLSECRERLALANVENVRILDRFDVEDPGEELFKACVPAVFSEPQTETASECVDLSGARVFALEHFAGDPDRRAASAAECIRLLAPETKPVIRTARVYVLYGPVTEEDIAAVKRYVLLAAARREASLAIPESMQSAPSVPAETETIGGFLTMGQGDLDELRHTHALGMDAEDMAFCQNYFRTEMREPTLTELRMFDVLWSEPCRRTAFTTALGGVTFEDGMLERAYEEYLAARRELGETNPVTLADVGNIACKLLKKRGLLEALGEDDACPVKIKVRVDGEDEDYLLLFGNGRDADPGDALGVPLAGKRYGYAAMHLSCAGDPFAEEGGETARGLAVNAEACSSYGNRAGIAAGQINEIYHAGYAETPLGIGAAVAAIPANELHVDTPVPGDKLIVVGDLLAGNATGAGDGAAVHKLERLLESKAMSLVKRCRTLDMGGIAAVYTLAEGLDIDLGLLDGQDADDTALALKGPRERLAVVVAESDAAQFISLAAEENLAAAIVGTVTAEPRLRMRRGGRTVVNVTHAVLCSNGAKRQAEAAVPGCADYKKQLPASFAGGMKALAGDVNVCSRRGLSERFDHTVGAGTVLLPLGGKYRMTPAQAMVHLIPLRHGHTDTVSYMAWGGDVSLAEKSPYHGAYFAVVESVAKLIATGASFEDIYLSLGASLSDPAGDPARFGQSLAAMLGAFKAQTELGVAAVSEEEYVGRAPAQGGLSALFSFAVTAGKLSEVISPEFKGAGHKVVLLAPVYDSDGLPVTASLLANIRAVTALIRSGKAISVYTPGCGGIAEAVLKMSLGNKIGFRFSDMVSLDTVFGYRYGSFILELREELEVGEELGKTTDAETVVRGLDLLSLSELQSIYEGKLEPVYPTLSRAPVRPAWNFTYEGTSPLVSAAKFASPRVLIPVFSGTNCEYDAVRAFEDAGAVCDVFVLRSHTAEDIVSSAEEFARRMHEAQIVFIPGGFAGREDGPGRYIAAFFQGTHVRDQVEELLGRRDGLMGGICNGFQALVKLGLLPFGKFTAPAADSPALACNDVGRFQSRIVRVRVASNASPWLAGVKVGDVYSVPVSHGAGKFVASDELIMSLAEKGQIMTQYVDYDDRASMNIRFNPSGSAYAIEGLLSPDGRIFGKMGHAERKGAGLYRNVLGNYDMKLFESAVKYFK